MAYCPDCPEGSPEIFNGQPFCTSAKRHLLYRFVAAGPGEATATAQRGQPGRISVEIRNEGVWDAHLQVELTGELAERGARVSPAESVECAKGAAVCFDVELPADHLTDVLRGELRIALDPAFHRFAQVPRLRNSLPVIPLRLELARPRIEVDPPRLEFRQGQGPRTLRIRNVGTEGCPIHVDREHTSPMLDVSGAAFPCDPGALAHELTVDVLWERLPSDQSEHALRLVLQPEHREHQQPVEIPVAARRPNLGTLRVPIGIDFGTSKTVVACVPPQNPLQRPEALSIQGRKLVPTVVALKRTDPSERYWGSNAQSVSSNLRHYVIIRSIKTALATDRRYTIHRRDRDSGSERLVAEYTPEQIAGYFMHGLLHEARQELAKIFHDDQVDIGRVVLTYPANWTNEQRVATRRAFMAAGIAVDDLHNQNEAGAAAISALQQHVEHPRQTILIYDMGAGTLDATIILKTTADGVPQYEQDGSAGGEVGCAGDFFDETIGVELTHQLSAQSGAALDFHRLMAASLETDERALGEQILKAARDHKERLSTTENPAVPPLDVVLPGGKTARLNAQVSRAQFNGWIADRVREATHRILDGVFASASKIRSRDQVELVLLVGGSVQVPLVETIVKEYFAGSAARVLKHIQPEFAVGLGAAVIANQVGIDVGPGSRPAVPQDKIVYSMGLEDRHGRFLPLVLAGKPCNERYSYDYELVGKGDIFLRLVQYIGPRKDPVTHNGLMILDPSEWKLLSSRPLKIRPDLPSHLLAHIDVNVDEGGILKVSVRCVTRDGRPQGDAVELVSAE